MRFVLILLGYGYLFFGSLLFGQGYTSGRNPIVRYFGALAKEDSRIADYKLDKRGQARHRLLATPLACEYDASYRLLRIEENSFDESVVITQIFEISEGIMGVSQSIYSPLSTDNSLQIWQRQGRRWRNISSTALPAEAAKAVLYNLDGCPPSVRQTFERLPTLYSYDPSRLLLQQHVDAQALRARCEHLQGENPNASRLPPVCELLRCAEFVPIFYVFDTARLRFVPTGEK